MGIRSPQRAGSPILAHEREVAMHMYDPHGFIRQARRRRERRRVILFAVVTILTLSAAVITLNLALSLAQR